MDYKETKTTIDTEGNIIESYVLQQILKQKNSYNNTSIMEDYWRYEKENGGSKITILRHYIQSIADSNNVVKLPRTAKKNLLLDIGISENRFLSFMNDLRKSQFIRGKNDFFMINPRISFKGSAIKRDGFINNMFWEKDFFLLPKFESSFQVRKMDQKNGL